LATLTTDSATRTEWPGRVGELVAALRTIPAGGSIVLPDGTAHPIGDGPAIYQVRFNTEAATRISPNEYKLGQAYVDGDIDIDGDLAALLDVRSALSKGVTPGLALRFVYDLLSSSTAMNSKAINAHYTHGDDLYLSFIDERYRFYSHCLFPTGGETLEEAAECKLESMYTELGLQPGMRLLDIGGGWGGVMQYCSPRGVDVTSVTLVEDSAAYIGRLKQERDLTGRSRSSITPSSTGSSSTSRSTGGSPSRCGTCCRPVAGCTSTPRPRPRSGRSARSPAGTPGAAHTPSCRCRTSSESC
jgi:cyclopropane-fatty-acyl-phospholipid synthase